MGKTLLIIGNGFTKDLLEHIDLKIDASSPFLFDVPDPFDSGSKLLDRLNYIKDFTEINLGKTEFEKINSFLKSYDENNEKKVQELTQLRHYVTLAYAYISLKIFERWKKVSHQKSIWRWEKWIKKNHHELSGIVSLNYDTGLEMALCKLAQWEKLDLDYYRIGSTENFHQNKISNGIPTQVTITQTQKYIRNGIPIFKPHGSCDFDLPSRLISVPPRSRLTSLIYMNNFIIDGYGLVEVVLPGNLMTPRTQVDVVLPGEVSKQTDLMWVKQGFQAIKQIANSVDTCIIVGISYQPCDRPEIDSIIDNLPSNTKIRLITPSPNPAFEEKLKINHTTPSEFFKDFV